MDYLEMRGICKSFGPVLANSNVDLSVAKGEIHAILGENGSGKSTLMNMLSGIYRPDSGTVTLDGVQLHISSPDDAIGYGIGMVHQHFKLVDVLTAAENIILGRKENIFFNRKAAACDIEKVCEKYGLSVRAFQKVYTMSVSEKQTVEIAKVLYRGAKVLILDEPTAVLTPQEIKNLFQNLRNMKKEGCSIIIITHKMNEVMEISDRVTVLRKGESVATVRTEETTADSLIEMMVGRPMTLDLDRSPITEAIHKKLLTVEELSLIQKDGTKRLDDVSFDLYGGEILGVAGISGSGQKELCEAIAGLQSVTGGRILLDGENLVGMTPGRIMRKGVRMSFVPEDRLGMGLVGNMSISDNILLKNYNMKPGFLIDRKLSRDISNEIIERYDVQTPSIAHQIKKLSGGNIQKVLLGRELKLSPRILVTAYPVRGLDIGASYLIYDILNEQKKNGVAVLFIGEDLDVLLALSDRIMVLNRGKNMGIYPAETLTKEQVGLLMMGLEVQDA